jgi:hypothetical protein
MEETQSEPEAAATVESRLSTLLHALRASRRRRIVRLLDSGPSEDIVSTRWLARQIAGTENNTTPLHATSKQYKNVYNALSQTHLPTLSSANIIIYDPQRQEIKSGPTLSLASLLLDLTEPTIEAFSV